MKTIITSQGNSIKSRFDLRFGRAMFFCLYDEVSKEIIFIENAPINELANAGIKASEKMIDLGVKKIISGDFGQKVRELLETNNIQMIIMPDDKKTIAEIIEMIK
ncbi:MAG: hypothetical protein K9G76_06280 [Bacteroidales bacterium]|nr:hypothetical protein [Bacteroidales bacterium]MCF8402364.1 hypothetical protein [Bacteroidales bacterium]